MELCTIESNLSLDIYVALLSKAKYMGILKTGRSENTLKLNKWGVQN